LGSRFDEHLLTSRLTALWREKLHRRVSLQGALVNVWGRGILIAGESGSGKTTLALELARRGHQWIADDAVEIEKEPDGRLSGRSQAAVKNLLEIKGSGVLSVRDILPPGSIADTTPVDMIADIRQDARRCVSTSSLGRQSRIIMGVRLPRLRIPRSGNRCGQIENAVRIMSEAGAA
jgi:HPr kinase/phosphorylase